MSIGTLLLLLAALVGGYVIVRGKRKAAQTGPTEKPVERPVPSGPWFLPHEGKEHGPFQLAQLVRFRDSGILLPNTPIRASSSTEILEAKQVPGLFIQPAVEFIEQPVEFQTFGGQLDPVKVGKGRVRVKDGALLIYGRRRRLFALRRIDEWIPLDQLYDVMVEDNLLHFRVEGQPSKQARLLKLATPAVAKALADCLPDRLSAGGAQVKADTEAYSRFLQQAGQPFVTLAIIAINVLIYVWAGNKGAGWWDGKPSVFIDLGGNFAPSTTQNQWWRLLTGTFLHSGFMHMAFNMWALWDAGRVAERLFGHSRYVALYLVAGLVGSLASINWQQEAVGIGASGAVFGVYGALTMALFLRNDLLPLSIAHKLRASGSAFIIYCLVNGFTHTGIDNSAHLGGLLGGALLGAGFVGLTRVRLWGAVAVLTGLSAFGWVRAVEVTEPLLDEPAFRAFLAGFGAEEARLNQAAQTLFKTQGQLPAREFATHLDQEVVSGWRQLETQIKSLHRVSNKNRMLLEPLTEFVETKRDAAETLKDGLTEGNGLLIFASSLKTRHANNVAAALAQKLAELKSEKEGKSKSTPTSSQSPQ
ncbi:MAG TPA: rhomboid family intramembrane serine protease [Rhodocyclaceae bacterium]|nr:rhomboid family intramembrane serine protease [Rhodocyclaceae bacterium]